MPIHIESIVKFILYSMGLLSVAGIGISLNTNVSKIRERLRIGREIKLESYNQKWLNNEWLKKYHLLLDSSLKSYKIEHFSKLVVGQFLMFISFIALFMVILQDFIFSFGISAIFMYVLPITGFYFIHKQRQNIIQDELVDTAILLLQEYEKNSHHMLYALKETVSQIKGSAHGVYAKAFARMHGEDDIKIQAAESLSFQIGHVRGKNLATIILKGCKDGTEVSTLLEDLVEDITEFNKRVRDAQTEARETALIGFAPIPALIILHFVNDKWLIPGGKAYYYQFGTQDGLKSFLIAVVFGLIGIGLGLFVRKPKGM
ncbi:hypothetical protein [Psychrobacillus sp. FSL H8-0487]|uniref:hypothetical protein n=1 Tax=Psychrobacillus sp. FSL H8-0487 TaxID=2921391 RepID=UPI0030F771AD